MAEKMAEQIAEILKESDYHTVEKALADFRRPMDGNSGIFWWILLWNDGSIRLKTYRFPMPAAFGIGKI